VHRSSRGCSGWTRFPVSIAARQQCSPPSPVAPGKAAALISFDSEYSNPPATSFCRCRLMTNVNFPRFRSTALRASRVYAVPLSVEHQVVHVDREAEAPHDHPHLGLCRARRRDKCASYGAAPRPARRCRAALDRLLREDVRSPARARATPRRPSCVLTGSTRPPRSRKAR
jgi:hypothetical protein